MTVLSMRTFAPVSIPSSHAPPRRTRLIRCPVSARTRLMHYCNAERFGDGTDRRG